MLFLVVEFDVSLLNKIIIFSFKKKCTDPKLLNSNQCNFFYTMYTICMVLKVQSQKHNFKFVAHKFEIP